MGDPAAEPPPKWRPFQLAFILLNLRGLADPTHSDRETADLLFFPTGGGKTEAYLGLAAWTIAHRRMTNGGLLGAGVTVLMRYTLRLLTLDQLSRAAGVVCALELMRGEPAWQEGGKRLLGDWPIEIGLWVGSAATPNRLGKTGDKRDDTAVTRIRRFRKHGREAPAPIKACPWCGTPFDRDSFSCTPSDMAPQNMVVRCANAGCDFTRDRPLPVLTVDEAIYRRLPAFLIATVDKFAGLPWVGEAGAFFGHVDRQDEWGFYGAAELGRGKPLWNGQSLAPPDLIIQDELHLISGPLGTVAALYEIALDQLATRTFMGKRLRPKVVASTATVRRAQDQVKALFDRERTAIFPPPGPDRRDSYFALTVPPEQKPGRLYVGLASPGRGPKLIFLRVLTTLLAAAHAEAALGADADAYETALCYFNALRELGGARRIVEDEVRVRLAAYGAERRRLKPVGAPFADRRLREPLELTSRVSTDQVAEAKERLALPCADGKGVDVAMATNMISVGLDIGRLGLMLVQGQPKSAAEYIQATSRVGRREKQPGLVLALLNAHKPRDRMHHEQFRQFHACFYRSVEATSVTPWAARALDRALAAVVVATGRHLEPDMAPEDAASRLRGNKALQDRIVDIVLDRAPPEAVAGGREALRATITDLLAAWVDTADEGPRPAANSTTAIPRTRRCYTTHSIRSSRALLRRTDDSRRAGPCGTSSMRPRFGSLTHTATSCGEEGKMADEKIRMSQVVGVFGPGAMLDLPERSVVVGGIDRWDMHVPGAFRVIEEPRLARLLHQRLANDPRLGVDRPPDLRTPPVDLNDRRVARPPSIESPVFPEWFVCDTIDGDTSGRRRLVRFNDLKAPARKEHVADDDGKRRRASPVRFVCGCTKGHLQDIEWRRILHTDGSACRDQMWLVDSGTSADPRDTKVVCECGKSLTLEELFQPGRLGPCRGERPWIGDRDPLKCDAPKGLNLLTRSATNTYFPQVAVVISLPQSEDELSRRIEQHWSVLSKAKNAAWLDIARDANPVVGAALEGFANEAVFARIQAIVAGNGQANEAKDPRLAEFELFSSGRELIGENSPRALLHAQTLDRRQWDPERSSDLRGIGSLVAVHRLREVSCAYGFTRFEPSALANDDLEDVGLAVEGAPLGSNPTWLPAIESFGEGVFLTFDAEALEEWLARQAVLERAEAVERGVSTWERARRQRGLQGDRASLGERTRPEYVMAHSLAHTLMTEVALDCGYPASSLKERIYVPPRRPFDMPQTGLLIYTASAGMQGTLGGLVEITGRFARVLKGALERLELCSGDPVCADHEPALADEDRALHGAACHSCLLVAETSCEARNLHLDRALLVGTVGQTGAGFFRQE